MGDAEDPVGFLVYSLLGERIGVVVESSARFLLVQRGRIVRKRYLLPRHLTTIRRASESVVLLAELDDVLVDRTMAEPASA